MTGTIFVDTNVFLYALDASDPCKQVVAAAWLERLWKGATGRTSVQVLSEFYVNATHKRRFGISQEEAWRRVCLLEAWRPLPVDCGLLVNARAMQSRFQLGWWDSLIVAAACALGCAVLLTEDLQDGARFDELEVRNPFTWKLREPILDHAYLPAKPIHPARGRPRKSRSG